MPFKLNVFSNSISFIVSYLDPEHHTQNSVNTQSAEKNGVENSFYFRDAVFYHSQDFAYPPKTITRIHAAIVIVLCLETILPSDHNFENFSMITSSCVCTYTMRIYLVENLGLRIH